MESDTHTPTPNTFFSAAGAFQRSAAIRAAVELNLFSALGAGHRTAAAVAEQTGASEKGIRVLCDYLTILGFLEKGKEGYELTPDSKIFLDRASPDYAGDALEFLHSPMMLEAFDALPEAVRSGGTALPASGSLVPEHEIWVRFARSMAPLMRLPARLTAAVVNGGMRPTLKVLDVAAGHGLFGISIAERHPGARIVAVDWPNVLEVAKENARNAGVADRFNTTPGNALDVDFGRDFDVVLFPNFLHHFNEEDCDTLIRKAYASLIDGGRCVTVEFVPNEDRVSPPEAAAFALMMLATTPGGDAYTFAEYERMFRRAGFRKNELHDLEPSAHRAIVSVK